jgi:pimeloyl-ACP methyl ester carboxylesterase
MDHVEAGGIDIAYERAGTGPPLVLLAGYVGDAGATWGAQIDDLSDEFTVVAWDTPGSGRSSDPPESFDLSDYADCLAAFMKALGLGPAHLVGLSFGGGLALEFYRRHPQIPISLVLASAYAGWRGSLTPEVVDQRLQQVLDLADLPPDRFAAAVLPTMFSPSAPDSLVQTYGANIRSFHPVGLRVMARAFARADLRDVLPGLAVPTLLLYGDADVRAPLDVAHGLASAIPDSKLVVLPGVGHVSSVEAPERFNAEVRSFLGSL